MLLGFEYSIFLPLGLCDRMTVWDDGGLWRQESMGRCKGKRAVDEGAVAITGKVFAIEKSFFPLSLRFVRTWCKPSQFGLCYILMEHPAGL